MNVTNKVSIIRGEIPPPSPPNTTGEIPLITRTEIYTIGKSIKAIIAKTDEYLGTPDLIANLWKIK